MIADCTFSAGGCPGAPITTLIDFPILPGIDDLHLCAYGAEGYVVIGCVEVGSSTQTAHHSFRSLLTLDLQPDEDDTNTNQRIQHISFGGGPHMLLAAATTHSITIFSLEHLVRHLFSHQTQRRSTFTNHTTTAAAPSVWSTLSPPSHAYHKVASLDIRQFTNNSSSTPPPSNASIVAFDWTQQLDGLLVSTTDRRLTMWALHAIIHNNHHRSSAIHDTDTQHPEGSLTLHWQTDELAINDNPELQQDIISAGVTVDAPSASTCSSSSSSGGGIASTANRNTSTSTTVNNSNSERNNVNVWWPQLQTKTAKREKLKHSCGVVGIEWSPGVLRKDVLAEEDDEDDIDVAVLQSNDMDKEHNDADGDDVGKDAIGGGPDVLNNDDHPALLTTGEDGALRIWVETVIVQYDPAAALHQGNNNRKKSTTIKPGSSSSPSPRDSTVITPKMDCYFCMTMVIDPPPHSPSIIEGNISNKNSSIVVVKAKWGRWVKALLGRREIPGGDAFWILSMVQYGGGEGAVQVRLHVVRGLSAIIVNSFGGNMSTAGAGSVTRQAKAVEWGHSASSLASSAASGGGDSGNIEGKRNAPGLRNDNNETKIETELKKMVAISRKKQFMSCWITTQDEYPEVNVFASTVDSDKGTLSMCGIRYATIIETGPGSLLPTKQLTSLSEWVAKGQGHTAAITAVAAVQGGGGREKMPAVATADVSGAVILWCPAASVARNNNNNNDMTERSINTANTWSPVCKLQCTTTSFIPPSSTSLESGSPIKQGTTIKSHTSPPPPPPAAAGLCMTWVGVDSTPLQLLAVSIERELLCYEFTALNPSDTPLSPKSPPSSSHHQNHQQRSVVSEQSSSSSYLLCSAAIPQALGTVISLHALSESRSILGAICAVGGSSGVALLCLWQCSIGGGGGNKSNIGSSAEFHSNNNRLPSLRLLGTVPLRGPNNNNNNSNAPSGIKSSSSIVCTASHGSDSIVLGYSDGTVKKMTVIVHGPGNIQLVQDFEYKINICRSGSDCRIVVASDAEQSLVAAAFGGDLHIKSAKATAGLSSSSSSSVVLSLPQHHVATSLAWLTGTVSPCVVVGCSVVHNSSRTVAMVWYALTRSGEWRCIASLKNTNRGGSGLNCLAVAGNAALVMAANNSSGRGGHSPHHHQYYQKPGMVMTSIHNRLISVSDHVTITSPLYTNDGDTVDGVNIPLAQHILQCSGPLVQYSPQFLSCLLHNMQYNAVEKIVTELVAWLKDMHLKNNGSASKTMMVQLALSGGHPGSGLLSPGRPLSLASHSDYGGDGGQGGSVHNNITAGVNPLSFNGIGLDELVLGSNSGGGGTNGLRDVLLKKYNKHGMFDSKRKNKDEEMGGGGGGGFVGQPSAAEQPAAPNNSGMLDMAAFGMDMPPAPQSSQDTGMLDLAAFGMDMPPVALEKSSPLPQQSTRDAGMFDLSAFGMDMPQSQPSQQPIATPTSVAETSKDIITIASTSTTKQNECFTAPAGQSLVTAEQLRPLPADLSVLLSVLLGAPEEHAVAVHVDNHNDVGGENSQLGGGLQSSIIGGPKDRDMNEYHQDSGSINITDVLPGLSLKDSQMVVRLIKQFSKASGDNAFTKTAAAATGPVDECGSAFLSAVACANVLGKTQPGRYNNGNDKQQRQQQQQHTSMNAAGVAYTLPLSLLGRGEGTKDEKECVFGMFPGLDMGSLFWALLSTTEESLLRHSLNAANTWLKSIKGSRKTGAVDGDTFMKSVAAAASYTKSSFAPPPSSSGPSGDSGGEMTTWAEMRLIGAGFWVRDALLLFKTAETLAKGQFAKNRNPDDAALLYTAMGKKSVLRGLYSSTNNKRQADFLGRDFSHPENQQAAIKNAYVLMSKHRHELAAAFFILGGSYKDAVGVCAKELKDPQLALFIARLLNNNGPGGEVERGLIEREVVVGVKSDGGGTVGSWGSAVCAWLLGDADKVVSSLLLNVDTSTAQLVSPARNCDGSDGADISSTTAAAAALYMFQLPSLLKFLLPTLPRLGLLRHQEKQKEEAMGQYHHDGQEDQERMILIDKVHDCLYSAAKKLASFGLPALAVQLETIADSQCNKPMGSDSSNSSKKEEEEAKVKMCAMALLTCRGKASSLSPEEQLTKLISAGLVVDKSAVLEKYHHYNSMVAHISTHTSDAAGRGSSSTSLNRQLSFETTQSTLSGHSLGDTTRRASLDLFKIGPHHHEGQHVHHPNHHHHPHHNRSLALLKQDHPLFRIEHDQLRAVATCSLMSKDVLGRTVVVATHKHGLVEGEAHVLLPPPVTPAAVNRPQSPSSLSSTRGSLVGGGGGGSGSASVASMATITTTAAAPVSPFVEESDANSGKNGLFSRVLSQIFDQAGWAADDGWGSASSEADFSAAALHAMQQQQQGSKTLSPLHTSNSRPSPSPQSPLTAAFASSTAGKFFTGGSGGNSNNYNKKAKPMSTSTIHTTALCAHPSRCYYLSGDDSRGRVVLWRFNSRTSLASFTPVPASELPALTNVGGLLESFSTRMMRPTGTSTRLSSWKHCTGLAFSPNGERFAGIGAGGVVATWRLAPASSSASTGSRPVDADGNISSEWWCQGLSKHGAAVTYVAGGSSAVAVGGQCTRGGNIALWDTLSHPDIGAIGRLSHHKAAVTCLYTLPGGWLLAAGDADGALSLTDIRMLGSSGTNTSGSSSKSNSTCGGGGGRVLWSVKASRGAVKSVVATTAAAGSSSSGMSGMLVTGGQDGAVRVWRSGDGHLVQSIEAAHYSGSNTRPKHGKLAMSGDLSSPTSSSSGVAVAVSGLSACSEGVVTCGADGMVRLFPIG